MRVVTLDCTRLSLLAARITPPSSTTVRKIFRDFEVYRSHRENNSSELFICPSGWTPLIPLHANSSTSHARLRTLSVTAVCAIAATALAVAMGIGRFAFTPLLPLMVRDGSLAPSAGAWLAAGQLPGLPGRRARSPARLGLSPAGADAGKPCRHRVTTAAMGVLDGLAAWMPALCRRRVQRLGAGRHQRVGLAAPGAGPPHGALRLGLRRRRPRHRLRRAVLPRRRAARRADRPAVAGTGRAGRARRGAGEPLRRPTAGSRQPTLHAGRRPATARRVARRARDLLRRARLRLHPAGHLPAGARARGGGRPADVRPRLARLRHRRRPSTLATGASSGACQSAARLGGQPSADGRGRRRCPAVARSGGDRLAALAVGGTFMVATMVGLQEARSRAPHNPTQLLAA